jgi:RNA polymerase sigma factor (sigma-70 family)
MPDRAFDSDDLLQDSLLRVFRHLPAVEPPQDGARLAYVHRAVANRFRDEWRVSARRPRRVAMSVDLLDRNRSPLDALMDRERAAHCRLALARLSPKQRLAVVAGAEWSRDYRVLATILGKPSPDAARVALGRAVARLSRELARLPDTSPRARRTAPAPPAWPDGLGMEAS